MRKNNYPEAVEISHSKIDRYGDVLRSAQKDSLEYDEAFACVSAWRASHLYPLNTFRSTLSRKTKGFKNAVIAQRLKRMPTIIEKLNRQEKNRKEPMRLSAMQDIGGLRLIAENLKDVYLVKEYYFASHLSHELKRWHDYIEKPKSDGYRGIHLIFQYRGTNNVAKQYDGLYIEVQLRTRLQHTWATAVEIAGLMTGRKLKNDEGSREWLRFFKLVSEAFEILEYLDDEGEKHIRKPDLDSVTLYENIVKLDEKIHASEKLLAFSSAMDLLDSSHRNFKYYIVAIDSSAKRIIVYGYTADAYESAVQKYQEMEKNNAETSVDQVLVSARNLNELKIAYPNYFADIRDFIEKIVSLKKVVDGLNDEARKDK